MKSTIMRSIALLAGVIASAPVVLVQQALAQDDRQVEEVITTGTRSQERSSAESPAPIDVITGEEFTNQAETDLASLVRNVVPSFNVNMQPISDAATIVRPANMRGLAPDHTLVLINGKRRHRAAVISWLGNGVADGSQGPDLATIPSIALKQVEVLRDGASSQYGSDAIAGVMNFILKDSAEGASIEGKVGQYSEGDGDLFSVAGNIGLPFSDNGFVNLSFEYSEADDTDRSVQRNDAARLIAAGNTAVANPAQIWGSPKIEDDIKLFANVGLDLGGDKEFYAHGNLSSKFVDGGFYFRNPNTRGAVFSVDGGQTLLIGDLLDAEDGVLDGTAGCPVVTITNDVPDPAALQQVFNDPNCFSFQEIFPGGFTPRFGGDVSDTSITAGVRGEMENGLRWDVSASGARNEVDFFIRNTVNASLGPATPTSFNPGDYTQYEQAVNADFSYQPTPETNLAFGAEYRNEEFQITTGQEESFLIGPLAPQGFSAASNGFPGFSNIAGGKFGRENVALYVDGEWEPTDELLLAAAVRWEDFQDFGTTTNGKIGANYRFPNGFGVRSTLSTGFKAPTPGQSNAFNVSTEFDFVLNDLVNRGTIPATSAVASFLGAKPLEPEESQNVTLGVFFDVMGFDVTIDYFDISVDDRLSLSRDFTLTDAQIDQLLAEGVTSAANLRDVRFFTNDFDTETKGVDVVATYPFEWANGGNTDISLVYNYTNTRMTRVGNTFKVDNPPATCPPNQSRIIAGVPECQLSGGGKTRIREYEEGLPEERYNISANNFFGPWRILGRVSYFDGWYDSEDGRRYGDATLVDAEAAYQMDNGFTFVFGANNLFDEVPDQNPDAADGVGNRYSQFSPFGFNGTLWYLRVLYNTN